jgi:MATE family multidrug resistance protein
MIQKKNLISSYWYGITDHVYGERYGTIVRYFIPEFITNLMLYTLPLWMDAFFISHLASTSTYATLGVTNGVLHLMIKIAEAFSIGTVVLSGQFNGSQAYKKVGQTMQSAFWLTCMTGILFAGLLYIGAPFIYAWYGVAPDIIAQGVPYLRLRSLGVLFMFTCLAFIGFLKGIKNTRSPMKIFMFGATVFVISDYFFVFGIGPIPAMGLQGSALASVLQYGSMLAVACGYVVCNAKNRQYGIRLFSTFRDLSHVKQLLEISWPVMLDKVTFALAYIWLGKMIAPMGTTCVAAYCAVRDIERFAFLPAIACAQIITFLVSNDYGAGRWDHIKTNIKKVIFVASSVVVVILIGIMCWSQEILAAFDKKGEFGEVVMYVLPMLSILVFFDLIQLILSGALRGIGNGRRVLMVRLAVFSCYFVPLSYTLAQLPITDVSLKFMLVYGSFYIGNALMSIIYINQFRKDEWKMTLM